MLYEVITNSVHRAHYQRVVARLTQSGAVVPFTLPPEAVLKKVLQALESSHPKPRYYVTFPTYLFAYLKRILSARMLDRILSKVS